MMKAPAKGSKGSQISLIIPAFNEDERIGEVIAAAQAVSLIGEIIVVNDGSIDQTGRVAQMCGAHVIDLPENHGKGYAMQAGIDATDAGILVFSDADIIGLNDIHFLQLIVPLIDDETLMMTVGKFSGGRLRTDLSQNLMPSISGQRALRRILVDKLPDLSKTRFGAELTITRYTKNHRVKVMEVTLNDLTHVMKEEKLGVMRGFSARLRMYQEMYKSIKPQKKL